MAASTPLIEALQKKTEEKIGTETSSFLCREKKILSVEKVQVFIKDEPESSKKQRLPFTGKVWLSYEENGGVFSVGNIDFSGQIEVMNFFSIRRVYGKPFVINIRRI